MKLQRLRRFRKEVLRCVFNKLYRRDGWDNPVRPLTQIGWLLAEEFKHHIYDSLTERRFVWRPRISQLQLFATISFSAFELLPAIFLL